MVLLFTHYYAKNRFFQLKESLMMILIGTDW